MRLLGPTQFQRLNEATGLVSLLAGLSLVLVLVSYHPADPSWNTATSLQAHNIFGTVGSHFADLLWQVFGLTSFLLPVFIISIAWQWIRSRPIPAAPARLAGPAPTKSASILFNAANATLLLRPVP